MGLQQYLGMCNEEIQNRERTMLVQLDFYIQNIKNFLDYLTQWIIKSF